MKKLTSELKCQQVRRQRWQIEKCRKIRSYVTKQKRKNYKKSQNRVHRGYQPALRYVAPKVITIDEPNYRSELIKFLANLRAHFQRSPNRTLLIDFSHTTNFVVAGTLLLYSELNRLILYSRTAVKLRCKEPHNDRASQVLRQIGIYRLCTNSCSIKIDNEDVVHWQVRQGTLVDNSLCAPAIEGFQGQLNEEMIDELLGGVGEAMTNAVHHAYDDVRSDGLGYQSDKNWWMFSQSKDGYLSVAFCDLGIGIPASLPIKRAGLWKNLLLFKANPTDSDCIREAIVEGKTSTGLDGRGYGLGNIVDVVENAPGAFVTVYSNKGSYSAGKVLPYPDEYSDSILGTLIHWKIPLEDK